MPTSMPLALVLAWVLLFGFVNTHQRHASHFQGSSRNFFVLLQASFVLGGLVCLGLLVYYFTKVAWYWPFVLFVVGSILGGLLFAVLDAKLGQLIVSFLAFVGWPAAAVWAYYVVYALHS